MTHSGHGSEAKQKFDEVRRFRRHLLDVRLNITVARQGARTTLSGRCKHVGEGGLGGVLAGELVPGEVVELEFQLPGAPRPLRIPRAIVRYRHGFHHGFEFLTVSPEQLESIKKLARTLPEVT